MSPELVIAVPDAPEKRVTLAGAFAVGRGSGNDLVIADASVSRRHALLRPFGRSRFFLLDMGSANGTFVNGRLVTNPVELKDGDTISIGPGVLRFLDPTGDGGDREEDTASMETAVNVTREAIAVLVVDIRNFTGLTEAIPPKELPAFIGSWFRDASASVESRGGTIDKYIGDALMAYWTAAPGSAPGALARAPLDAALELVDTARLYDGQLVARHPGLSFAIGCGIHCGEAMVGNITGSGRRDFTAIGDSVNAAFRLEALCKELGRPVLVSAAVRDAAADGYAFEDLGPRELRGKSEKIRVYAVAPPVSGR